MMKVGTNERRGISCSVVSPQAQGKGNRLTLRRRSSRRRRRTRRHQPRLKMQLTQSWICRACRRSNQSRLLPTVTAFLRQGIPQDLSRAALRRAWAADPAIRDFVGLAENAWDFNDPYAMPGFGPLDCSEEQLGALVDRIVGRARSAADSPTTPIPEQKDASPSADSNHEPLLESGAPETVADLSPAEEISSDEPPSAPAAVQPEAPQSVESDQTSPRRRTHGSALPR